MESGGSETSWIFVTSSNVRVRSDGSSRVVQKVLNVFLDKNVASAVMSVCCIFVSVARNVDNLVVAWLRYSAVLCSAILVYRFHSHPSSSFHFTPSSVFLSLASLIHSDPESRPCSGGCCTLLQNWCSVGSRWAPQDFDPTILQKIPSKCILAHLLEMKTWRNLSGRSFHILLHLLQKMFR